MSVTVVGVWLRLELAAVTTQPSTTSNQNYLFSFKRGFLWM